MDEFLKDQSQEFENWIEDQSLGEHEKELFKFHLWMREDTDLTSGSIVDYRKYVAKYINQDGVVRQLDAENLTSHESAAISKFQEYKSSNFSKKGDEDR